MRHHIVKMQIFQSVVIVTIVTIVRPGSNYSGMLRRTFVDIVF